MQLQPEHGVQASLISRGNTRASIIRGTAGLAMCSDAVGSMICESLGVHFGDLAKLAFVAAGVIAGVMIGARETR